MKAGVIDPAKVVRSAAAERLVDRLAAAHGPRRRSPRFPREERRAADMPHGGGMVVCTKSFGIVPTVRFVLVSHRLASMRSPVFFSFRTYFTTPHADPGRPRCLPGSVMFPLSSRGQYYCRAVRVEQRSWACGERHVRFEHLIDSLHRPARRCSGDRRHAARPGPVARAWSCLAK